MLPTVVKEQELSSLNYEWHLQLSNEATNDSKEIIFCFLILEKIMNNYRQNLPSIFSFEMTVFLLLAWLHQAAFPVLLVVTYLRKTISFKRKSISMKSIFHGNILKVLHLYKNGSFYLYPVSTNNCISFWCLATSPL